MSVSLEDFVSILKSHLTAEERSSGVAYAVETPVIAGTRLQFPRLVLDMPWEGYLAFIDHAPMANWGHPARYVLVSRESGEFQSFEARLPPFRQTSDLSWHVVYKAPSVPNAAVAIPQ